MEYIQSVSELVQGYEVIDGNRRILSKPEEATGLLKWKIRIIKSRYVLIGKCDAIFYY